MDEELYDSKEVIDKCLKCPYLECVNCIGKPKKDRYGKTALKVSEMLKQGESRMQIRCALKLNKKQLTSFIDFLNANEVADENDQAVDDIIYDCWSKGMTAGQIAKLLGTHVSALNHRIGELGLR